LPPDQDAPFKTAWLYGHPAAAKGRSPPIRAVLHPAGKVSQGADPAGILTFNKRLQSRNKLRLIRFNSGAPLAGARLP
jgi:hypothetical protein